MACSPSSSTDKSDREISDAVNQLISGKRHLLVNDYMSAVSSLQEACQLFSKQYGETANECAEPYLYYGKALLEYSRMETGVLGNALQGVPAEDEDDDDDEESEEGDEEKDEQVENPDKVTGEEREQIIREVEAAIDENSRDLEEKMEEMKRKDGESDTNNLSQFNVSANSEREPKESQGTADHSQANSKEAMEISNTETSNVKESSETNSEGKCKEIADHSQTNGIEGMEISSTEMSVKESSEKKSEGESKENADHSQTNSLEAMEVSNSEKSDVKESSKENSECKETAGHSQTNSKEEMEVTNTKASVKESSETSEHEKDSCSEPMEVSSALKPDTESSNNDMDHTEETEPKNEKVLEQSSEAAVSVCDKPADSKSEGSLKETSKMEGSSVNSGEEKTGDAKKDMELDKTTGSSDSPQLMETETEPVSSTPKGDSKEEENTASETDKKSETENVGKCQPIDKGLEVTCDVEIKNISGNKEVGVKEKVNEKEETSDTNNTSKVEGVAETAQSSENKCEVSDTGNSDNAKTSSPALSTDEVSNVSKSKEPDGDLVKEQTTDSHAEDCAAKPDASVAQPETAGSPKEQCSETCDKDKETTEVLEIADKCSSKLDSEVKDGERKIDENKTEQGAPKQEETATTVDVSSVSDNSKEDVRGAEQMNVETEDNNEESAAGEESENTGDKSQDEDSGAPAAPEGDEAGPSTSTGEPKEENEEEVTNLQLAWEMLELSKVIYKRQSETDKTKELKVAEVLLKLGEVSIESENYPQAVEDLTECLNIQKKHLQPHDRAIAETLYQLGLATSFNNQYELAIEHFTNSMRTLEERILVLKQSEEDKEKLKSRKPVAEESVNAKDSAVQSNKENICEEKEENKENTVDSTEGKESTTNQGNAESKMEICEKDGAESGKDSITQSTEKKNDEGGSGDVGKADIGKDENATSSDDDPWQDTKREIEELEELIPDIKAKIEDTEDMMKNAMQSLKEAAMQRLSESMDTSSPKTLETSSKSEENAKPITNISHLVKRKRKPEEECSSAETNDLKKPRPSEELEENHVNGDTVLNGDSKPMETDEPSKVKAAPVETKPEAESSVA